MAKGRTNAALPRQLAGYAILGVRLGALAPCARGRAWVAVATAAQPVRDRVRWLPVAPTRLRLAWRGHHFSYVVGDRSELDVLDGVFLHQDYDVPLERPPTTIMDLGSNAGATIHYFRARYPEAAIIGLEPDPDTFARLCRNVRGLPNVTVRREAVGARDGEAILAHSQLSWASALGSAHGPGIKVSTRNLDSLMNELGLDSIDLLKLDVEGAEHEVLEGFTRMGDVAAVVGEYHPGIHGRRFEELEGVFDGFDLHVRGNRDGVRHFRAVRRSMAFAIPPPEHR
ncbi:MAG: FkbM family methyltransferase [Actinomycetota bacterium]|nr:FkbM family methyltransferase [Actinomycetota bacterium]